MATFTLLVTQSPFDRQASYSALRFAMAAVESGHVVNGVFFYQSGVNNSNSFQSGHSDELNMFQKWCDFHEQHQVPLQVCVTAANRRGIINAEDAKDLDIQHFNLSAPFEEVGLGDLMELMNSADRTIQF